MPRHDPIRTTREQRRFTYGPQATTLAQVAGQGYASLPIAESDVTGLVADLAAKAPLASPVFTGDPRAPTPASGDGDTSIATTAYVQAQGYAVAAGYLPLSGGTVTGSLTVSGRAALMQTDFGASLATRTGYIDGTNGNAAFGNIAVARDPTVAWAIDGNGCQVTIANGASAVIPAGAGLLMVNCAGSSGEVALYLVGTGSVALVGANAGGATWVAPTTTPAAGKASVAWSGTAYRIYSNVGSSQVFRVMGLRIRDAY